MAITDPLQREQASAVDISAQASNLDALMVEVSVTAGRGMIAVCCEDEDEPELVAVRPLAARAVAVHSQDDWQEQSDAVIFGWLVSP